MPSQDEETLRNQLVKRIRGGESLEVEFKRGKGGLPDEIWPTASAFANTNGGWIIVGIRETEEGIEVEGASKPKHRLQEVNSLFRNHQKISHPVCGSSDVSIMELKGEPLLVMRIRAVSRRQRPVYINGNPYAGTYVRRHEGDYTCNKAEVDRMMREASDVTADSAILEHFDASDIDEGALSRYRQRFQNQNLAHAWNEYDDARFLRAIEAYDKQRETGKEGLTVAGLLLLGKREAIRDWRPRHLIDYRLLPEEGARERWDDRITWDGNLLGAFEEIYPKLVDNSATPFRLNEGGSRSGESPTQVATREALVNLLVHTDYAESQAAVIFHHGEGYFFRNPGNSRVSKSDLLSGDRSEPRNPILVTMFRLVGLAEEAGTGIPSIFQAWRELGYQYPKH